MPDNPAEDGSIDAGKMKAEWVYPVPAEPRGRTGRGRTDPFARRGSYRNFGFTRWPAQPLEEDRKDAHEADMNENIPERRLLRREEILENFLESGGIQ